MDIFLVLMVLVLITVAMVIIGDKTGLPWPALVTLITAVFVFIPGTPDLIVPPELILPIFLPPLLWALARRSSWGVIREQWITIAVLSVLLVIVTMFAVAGVVYWMIPSVGFAAAVAIGAAVAPPDPVAVESVAEPAGIPRRILTALQTEGLFNDAASIVAFHLALAVVMEGKTVTPWGAFLDFSYAAVAAVVIGLAVARLVAWTMNHVEPVSARNVLFWLVPFATYVLAEQVHASGVIAVVIACIDLNSRAPIEAEDRLASSSFWNTVDVLFTGAAFGMIGLTVSEAITEVGSELWFSVAVGVAISITAIIVRALMLLIVCRVNLVRKSRESAPTSLVEALVMAWSGMRGLVTLALVLSVPYAFPARREFAVIALTVLLITMVIPGLLLPTLMNRLNMKTSAEIRAEKMRHMVIKRVRDAAVKVLHEHYLELDTDVSASVQHWFEHHMAYNEGVDKSAVERRKEAEKERDILLTVRSEILAAAQEELLKMRMERCMNPMIVDDVLKDVDRLAIAVSQ